jgi:16S rRNA (adenine1518-N6/adenine1519-N6)-dimethyltransferase
VVDLVHAGFAHRRKALPRSLSLAPRAQPGVRERARAALERMGHPADERAERLTPAEFARLAEELRE